MALRKADPLHRVSLPHFLIHMTEWILDNLQVQSSKKPAARCRTMPHGHLAQINNKLNPNLGLPASMAARFPKRFRSRNCEEA